VKENPLMSNKRTLPFTAVVFSILLLSAAPAIGAHPLKRAATLTQGNGKTQIEAAYQYNHDNDSGVKTQTSQPHVQLTYGILDPLDAIVTVPYLLVRQTHGGTEANKNGIGDVTLALKWRFYGEKEKGLQFAIKPSVTFPTGDEDKGLGYGREAYGITFISTFEREEWCVSANLGYLYNEYGLQSNRDAYRKDIWSASLSGQYEFVEKLWLVGEVGVLRNPNVTSDTLPAFINAGVIYELTKSIDLDIGYRYGLTKPAVDYSISGAVTIRF
jgi:predicted porin